MTALAPLTAFADELRKKLPAGAVLAPGEPGFDEHRLAWNLAFEHHPAVIVKPTDGGDVAVAVGHAAEVGLAVAVQATGHGVIRPADDAMLIVMTDVDDVVVDPENWTARIGAGAKWQKVLDLATALGLAPLLGSTPDVGAVGYTLGGGMGWLARKYGLSADHVRSIDIVTADGVLRTASPESESELFWALRGGGAGSLGVVTSIEIDLVPVTSIYAGNLLYPAGMARDVFARYREWLPAIPDELTSSVCLMNFPPIEDVPEIIRGRSFTIVRGAFIGSDAEGEHLLRHWRRWRIPELDMWGRIPMAEIATVSNDPLDPMPAVVTTEWVDDITDRLADILTRAVFEQDGPSPVLFAELRHAGGAMARAPEVPNAYGNRERRHLLEAVGIGFDAAAMARLEAFLGQLRADLSSHVAGGAYLNFLEGDEKVRRASEGFDEAAWERLRALKAELDPGNVFRNGLPLG